MEEASRGREPPTASGCGGAVPPPALDRSLPLQPPAHALASRHRLCNCLRGACADAQRARHAALSGLAQQPIRLPPMTVSPDKVPRLQRRWG